MWRTVAVCRLVVDNKFTIGEVKAVTCSFKIIFLHLSLTFRRKLRQFVDALPGICTSWNTEAKLKFIAVDNLSPEEMLFYEH